MGFGFHAESSCRTGQGQGDVIISRRNDPTVTVYDGTEFTKIAAPVRNGNRWQIYRVDPENHRIAARRVGDGARAVFSGDYLSEHVCHGFAVTVHSAQGATCDTTHAVLSDRSTRAGAYVAMTRGRTSNSVYLYDKVGGEGDHEHPEPEAGMHLARRGTSHQAATLLRTVLGRDDRAQTVMATAANTDRALLPESVRDLLDTHDRTVTACRTAYRHHHTSQAVERELVALLPGLREQVALLEVAAGGRSGASMFTSGDEVLSGLKDESTRRAVRAVTQDVHAVQVLAIHPDAAEQKSAVLAAITAAAHDHQKRLIKSYNQSRPGVLALPATQRAADQAAELSYADTIRRPATAVTHFADGSWSLPVGSLVIVDDADHLHPDLLKSLVDWAAVRTNTKLLLITNEGTNRSADRTRGDGVAVLQEALPWAQRIGTPPHREHQSDNVIDRAERRLTAAADTVDGPAAAEATELLLARHTHLTDKYYEEVFARERFITDMAQQRNRDRERGLDRDDGLEL